MMDCFVIRVPLLIHMHMASEQTVGNILANTPRA